MTGREVIAVLYRTAEEIRHSLGALDDWGLAGTRAGQYRSDLVADKVALEILGQAGLGVLSEESGLHDRERDVVVVLDPVDGSTNASRGIPWWATSLCAVDADGPLAAVVVNQATGTRFDAVRGEGATCDGRPIRPSRATTLRRSILGVSGYPRSHYGWGQFRSLGAAALDLCAVASGMLDGFVDCAPRSLAVWDYLGGMLICQEAGAQVSEPWDRQLAVVEEATRRTIVAAATTALLDELMEVRRQTGPPLR